MKSGSDGSAFEDERIVRLAEEAGVLAVRHVAAGVADRPRQQDVRRHVALRPFELSRGRSRRADARCRPGRAGRSASSDARCRGRRRRCGTPMRISANLSACFAIRGKISLISIPGTLVLIGLVGPADLGRRVRLHVPGVELTGPADQEQHDAVDVVVGRPRRRPSARRDRTGVRPKPPSPSAPACRKSRRVSPSQKWTALCASSLIIEPPEPSNDTRAAAASPRVRRALSTRDRRAGPARIWRRLHV